MKGGDIIRQAKELAEHVVAQRGMELIDVEYMMEHGRWILRFYIDKPGGVTVDDCGDVSEELGVILDVKDIIRCAYDLEVSSPGPDRPVTKENDFLKYAGRRVRIKTKQPIEGRRNFTATIDGFKEGKVLITDSENKKWEIPFEDIEKARLEIQLGISN